MNEYLLSVNSFQTPKILGDRDATYTLLIRLILLEPGTIQSHPEMGVGIVSRYRYSDVKDLKDLQIDIDDQIAKYLPALIASDVNVSNDSDSMSIIIEITIDGIVYAISFNKTTYTLKNL